MRRVPAELNIISIDPSVRSTGIVMMKHGKITTRTINMKEDRIQLLGQFVKLFSKIAKEEKWDLLLIEDYAYGAKNSNSITRQAEIGGIIRACFSAFNTPIIEIPIPTWKAITMFNYPKSSSLEKSEYIMHFQNKFGGGEWTFTSCDEVDAALFIIVARECSRGHFIKGQGSRIRCELDAMSISL